MSIKVNTGFLNQSATPLDSRQVVETLDDLLALDENIIYDGLECYVVSSDCKYKFNSNYNESDTGHWKLISVGEATASDIIVAHTPDEADALRKKVNRNKLMFYMGNTKSSYVHGELYYLHWNAITLKKFYTKGGGILEIDYDVLEKKYASYSQTITFNAKYKEDPSNAMNRWFCEYSGGSGSRLDVVGVNIANGSETLGDVIEFTYNSASKNSDNYTWKPLFVKPQRTFEKNWWLVNKIATYGGGYDNEFINGHRYQFTADVTINATASGNIVVSLNEEQYKNYFGLHSKSSFIYNANTGCFEYRYGAIGYEDNRFTIEYLNKAGITWTGEIANDDAIIVTCTMSDNINDYYWKDLEYAVEGDSGNIVTLTQSEYDALTDDEKMDGREYRTYDTGHIYKLGVEYGKDADISRSEVLKTYVSLYNLNTKKGLSLEWENNVDNTQKIIDALDGREEFMDSFSSSTNRIGIVGNYGTTINNFHIIKRSADLAIITATTNDGTILNRTYTNGTLSDWCVNIAVYTSLSELGLTADATFQDVVDKLPKGGSALLGVTEFTNYQTIFPYEEGNDQFARVHIVKGTADGSRMYARWFRKDGVKEALAKFSINTNKFDGWQEKSPKGLVSNSQNFKIDITKNNASWYGMFTFNFVYGTTPCEITVAITTDVYYTITKGQDVVSAITYTQDGANYTIGIDLTAKIYGTQVVDMPTEFGVVNSFTAETYAGDTTANLKLDSARTYTTLAELGLDNTATIDDVRGVIPVGGTCMIRTDAFADLTQFNGIQWGYLKITNTVNKLSEIWLNDVTSGEALYYGRQSSGKFTQWVNVQTQEIVHTSLTGNLSGITTVLDLVNALLTEYRATSPKKPIRFVSGEFTKTTLTDLPVAYGLLQITVAGWDVIEVRLAHSANGFKTMYYGFMNRISGEESISSITWKEVTTKSIYNSVAELNKAKGTSIELVNGEDNTKKIVDTLSVGEQFVSFYHNNANQNRFGIDVSYGNLIHEIRITKCLDADLAANYATVTAFMNTGCVMSRIYYKTYSTDWSSTKDYVESLLANS